MSGTDEGEPCEVRCVACWQDYTTTIASFKNMVCKCPKCGDWKAQRTGPS